MNFYPNFVSLAILGWWAFHTKQRSSTFSRPWCNWRTFGIHGCPPGEMAFISKSRIIWLTGTCNQIAHRAADFEFEWHPKAEKNVNNVASFVIATCFHSQWHNGSSSFYRCDRTGIKRSSVSPRLDGEEDDNSAELLPMCLACSLWLEQLCGSVKVTFFFSFTVWLFNVAPKCYATPWPSAVVISEATGQQCPWSGKWRWGHPYTHMSVCHRS